MMENWDTKPLRELADIRVSNVDKKSFAHEKAVRLCNYMDVYSNQYVTSKIEWRHRLAHQKLNALN
jgi:type I restriction enzyme S subunit